MISAVRSASNSFERELDQAFGLAVDARGRLVHHQDARVVGERAREREQLALAGGKIGAALAESPRGAHRAAARRSAAPARASSASRTSLLAEIGAAQADVLEDVVGEEEDVLLDQADRAAEFGEVPFAHVDAVDQDSARGDVVKAVEQLDDGGLARAGGADDRDLLARLDPEAEVAQHRLARTVGEGDVVEDDLAAPRATRWDCAGLAIAGDSSISASIRSTDASADCSVVYLVEMSRSGMKNILAYSIKATSVPSPIRRCITSPPPTHTMTAT